MSTLQLSFPLAFTPNVSHLNEHTSVHTVSAAEANRTEIGTYFVNICSYFSLQMQSADRSAVCVIVSVLMLSE